MKICIIFICLSFYVGGEKSCKSKAQDFKAERQSNSNELIVNNPPPQELGYEVLMTGCSEDEKCVVIAYCDPASFNREGMEKILEKLSTEFKKKKVVNVNLFDKKDLAQAYAKGIRSPRELQYERRGWYLRTDDREFLLFYPDPNNQGKPISIKPKHPKD